MIIRAIDLGYQKTKIIKKNKNKWELMVMPSIAPIITGVNLSGSFGGLLGKRDTKIIEIDGINYEVGPEADDLQSVDNVKSLDSSYIFSDVYKAIYLGALDYINEPEIDLLVVGLPISNLVNVEKLKKISIGEHKVSEGRIINVKDVLVLPQPLGGFYTALYSGDPDLNNMESEYNLIVDPGSVTYDFLCTHGRNPIENRSDAHPGGMLKVLNAIADSINKKYGKEYRNLSAIEKSLLSEDRSLKLPWQKEKEDLLEHIKKTKTVLESSVTAMKNKAGDGTEQELNNIIVVGGGSSIFVKKIKEHYPDHNVKILDKVNIDGLGKLEKYSPMFAIVIGYLIAGAVLFKTELSEIE